MNTYKKFFFITLSTAFVSLFLICILLLTITKMIAGTQKIQFNESQVIHNWYVIKDRYAANKEEKKIVIGGGSNTLYSVSAAEIEKQTGIPTLNYGTHAGLQSYIFHHMKKVLNKGDVLILPLEYAYYLQSNADLLSPTAVEYSLGFDKSFYEALPLEKKFVMALYLLKAKSLLNLIKIKKASPHCVLNSNGDATDNLGQDPDAIKKNKPYLIIPSVIIDDKSKKWILFEFLQWCKDNKIRVYATYPAIIHPKETSEDEKKSAEEIRKFYNMANVKILGNPEDGFFETKYFYNTHYHLNREGQTLNTKRILKYIKAEGIDKMFG